MSELVFFRRGEEVLRFALDGSKVVLGRGDTCDVTIPDPEVSRTQVALTCTDGAWSFADLSTKGTVVQGKRQGAGALPDGADIALGQWRCVYRQRTATDDSQSTEVGNKTELAAQNDGDVEQRQAVQVRIKGNGQEVVQKLQAEQFTVGKDDSNDLVLGQRFVSSKHLKITRQDNRFHVIDQHSTNGTWLGQVRVFEVEVPLFTTLKVGEAELSLEPAGVGVAKPASTGPAGSYQGMIGNDPSVKQLAELIERVAPSQAAVTILGESGTGKELVARAVHNRSQRSHGPFIPVNCAAISKELIESELFGHEKGAFTGAANARKGAFEEADGGTIFLDEIGELPLDLQAKLLRALESGEIKRVGASRPITVDVRIVAATNRDLRKKAHEGSFREDLYYRLCVIPIHLPPLRNRAGDVIALAEHFLKAFSPKGPGIKLTAAAAAKLSAYGWPGNIRELRNAVHRGLLLRKGTNVDADDIVFDSGAPQREISIDGAEYVPGISLDQMLAQAERQIITSALKKLGKRELVAKELGVARSTLFKRLKEWGLTNASEPEPE